MIESISISELKKLQNINIIDIRNIEKYNSGHINNSINLPLNNILINFNIILDKSKKYYIYCQRGIQSKKLCQILKNNGYNVVNISGGYEEYLLKR